MQFAGGHDGAGGAVVAKKSGIDRVDAAPQADIRDIDRGLEHQAAVAAGGLEDRRHVLQRLLCLLFDRARAALPALGVNRKLANEAFVNVRTLNPDNLPVTTKGEVAVYRIRYGGADSSEVREEEVKRWEAGTDAEGRLSFKYPLPGEGQYRIVYRTRDSWKEEVLGNAIFWVARPAVK